MSNPINDRRQYRGDLTFGTQTFTHDQLRRAARAWARYEQHTAEREPFSPSWAQLHDMECRLENVRAKCVGWFLIGLALGVCFGYWLAPQWVHHG